MSLVEEPALAAAAAAFLGGGAGVPA